jgi:hypothetical protein
MLYIPDAQPTSYILGNLLAVVILRRRCPPGFELGIVHDLWVIDALSTTEIIDRHCTTTWAGGVHF